MVRTVRWRLRKPQTRWWAWLLCTIFLPAACIDGITAPVPVVKLDAPASPVEVSAGSSALVAVQAVDVQDHGVNGARVAFVRTTASEIDFETADAGADSVVVTTSSGTADGLQAVGVASVRILVPSNAPLGDTSIVAIVSGPTTSPTAAVATRIPIRITAEADGGTRDGATDQ
jgi:hypothetical protein